jgi:hypothetical protein
MSGLSETQFFVLMVLYIFGPILLIFGMFKIAHVIGKTSQWLGKLIYLAWLSGIFGLLPGLLHTTHYPPPSNMGCMDICFNFESATETRGWPLDWFGFTGLGNISAPMNMLIDISVVALFAFMFLVLLSRLVSWLSFRENKIFTYLVVFVLGLFPLLGQFIWSVMIPGYQRELIGPPPITMLTILLTVFFVCLLFSPAIILAAMMQLPPIYRLAQRDLSMHYVAILGNGLLCLVITYLMLAWPATALSYDTDSYYTIQKLRALPVPGITQTDVRQFKWAIVNEMWLRQIIPGDQACIGGNALVCQLADVVSDDNSPENSASLRFFIAGVALVLTLFNLLLSWDPPQIRDKRLISV